MSNILNDILGVIILLSSLLILGYILGLAFQSDLDDIEKNNPKYRKYLKDKYDI